MPLKRFKLTIEYDGTAYAGWQRQENAPSIQEAIEKALLKFCPLEQVSLFVAGRTDAGVHALGQVAHVDLPESLDAETIKRAVNAHLQDQPIVILESEEVSPEFHARFSARKRRYRYLVVNRREKLALDQGKAWHVPVPLDLEMMREGAQFLLGHHDFTSFRTVHCQAKSPLRTLEVFEINKVGDQLEFLVEAPSFLHHQVRNMVGTLGEVGKGRWAPGKIQEILAAKDRTQAGPTAPPHGLYFLEVLY